MTNVVNNDGVGLSKFVTPTGTGDVTANEQITDSVDFPHTGLLKALYTTATGNYALKDGAAGSMGFNFTYSGGSSPQLAVSAGKIFRDGKYVSVSALSATALTKASSSGTKVYHIVVVNSSNALAIRQSGATATNKIPDLTDGDIPIGVVEVSDSANTGTASLPTQFFTSFKTSNNVNIGYENSNAYTEAGEFTGSATGVELDVGAQSFTVKTTGNTDALVVESTDAGATDAPDLVLYRSSSSPAVSDEIGSIRFRGKDDGTNNKDYARIVSVIRDVTAASTDADIIFKALSNNTEIELMKVSRIDGIVINEIGANYLDTRIESDNNAHMFFVDSSADAVGIGQDTPTAPLHIKTTGTGDALIVESTDADATGAPDIVFYRNSATQADADDLGHIKFRGRNSANSGDVEFVDIYSEIAEVGDSGANKAARLYFRVQHADSITQVLKLVGKASGNAEVVVNDNGDNDISFRVEGDSNANLIYTDPANDSVGIGTASPDANAALSVEGALSLDEISAPTNTADRGQLYTNADNELHMIDGAGNDTIFLKGGQHSIWIPAEAISPRGNAGCADLATTNAATNGRPDIRSLAFDKDSDEHAQFTIAMPKMWNEGTITAQFYWTNATATSGTVAWGLQGVSLSNDDAIDTAFGTAVVTSDTQTGTAKDVHISPKSGAITIAGSPAANDLTCFQVYRDVSADNLAEDALLLGIKLLYTIDTGNDA